MKNLKRLRRFIVKNHCDSHATVIAVLGTEHNAGTTHICLALASYYANVKGLRIALAEPVTDGKLGFLIKSSSKTDGEADIVNRIRIYRNIDVSDIRNIPKEKYDYIILDLSCEYERFSDIFNMSDYRIMVCNLSDWRKHITYAYLYTHNLAHLVKDSVYVYSFGMKNKRDKDTLDFIHFPFEENPLQIKAANLKFYDNFTNKIR